MVIRDFDWNPAWYVARYPDIAQALERGLLDDPLVHYLAQGHKEGRFPSAAAEERARQSPEGRPGPRPEHLRLGDFCIPLDWPVGGETAKTFIQRLVNGFFNEYMSGSVVLDIGYRGGRADAVAIFPHAIGVDLDYPGYDGVRLPFEDASIETVFASHVLEHVPDYRAVIRDWFRVIKIGGFIVCIVPHQYLYEKKRDLPSKWNPDHKRFYTPASLIREFEESLAPNSYRVRHLSDNDLGYVYETRPDEQGVGCYEIELVIQKIALPLWELT